MRYATAIEPDPSFITLCINVAQSTFSDVMPSDDGPKSSAIASRKAAARSGPAKSWTERFSDWMYRQQVAEREAYFAQATDIFDLERRMREYDRRMHY